MRRTLEIKHVRKGAFLNGCKNEFGTCKKGPLKISCKFKEEWRISIRTV